jgi:hypothetical protein
MKNVLRTLTFAALLATFSLPALAQDAAASGGATASAQDEEAKAALYAQFVELIKKPDADSQRRASEIGKQYLSKYGTPATDADRQVVNYITNWVGKYEKAVREYEFNKAVGENPARAYELGRQWLSDSPDRLETRLGLVQAGFIANDRKDKSLNAEMVAQARAALQAIEQGKAPQQWTAPWTNRDTAVALLNYAIGLGVYESAPNEAIPALIKVAQSNGPLKTNPAVYTYLALSYQNGDFKRYASEYQQQCEGKEASAECDALFAKVSLALDHTLDAYARAAAYTKDQNVKAALVKNLNTLYKARFQNVTNPEANVQTLVAGITALPVPQPSDPVTLPGAPAPEPAATTSSTATPTAPASTTTPAPAAKPAAQPATPRPRL